VPTIWLLLGGCSPSVPHPADKARAPDAAADAPVSEPGTPDSRLPISGAADAHSDVVTDGRGDTSVDTGMDATGDPRRAVDAAVPGDGGDAPTTANGNYDGPPPVLPRAGEVAIDELLVNPAGTDTNREWIEIVNSTTFALDLRQLYVADAASELPLDAGVLPAGGVLVLGQSLDPTKNGGAPVDLSFGNTISLNNPGDSITLCLGPCADGLILSQVSWTSDLGAAYDGHAAMVDRASGAFCPADQPFGAAGSFGSPGEVNAPCPGADAAAQASTDAGTDAGGDKPGG
jgi:hypothetical protein